MKDKKRKKFDFWNDHSLWFLEMVMKRDYQETLARCDGYGKKQREQGSLFVMNLPDAGRTLIPHHIHRVA